MMNTIKMYEILLGTCCMQTRYRFQWEIYVHVCIYAIKLKFKNKAFDTAL